jgi:hypothetical protein
MVMSGVWMMVGSRSERCCGLHHSPALPATCEPSNALHCSLLLHHPCFSIRYPAEIASWQPMSSQLRPFVPQCTSARMGSTAAARAISLYLPILCSTTSPSQPFLAQMLAELGFRVFSSGYAKLQKNSYCELSLQTVSCHFHDGDRGDRQVGRLFLEYCMVIFDGVACRSSRHGNTMGTRQGGGAMQALVASLGARRQMKNMLQTESGNFHLFFSPVYPSA